MRPFAHQRLHPWWSDNHIKASSKPCNALLCMSGKYDIRISINLDNCIHPSSFCFLEAAFMYRSACLMAKSATPLSLMALPSAARRRFLSGDASISYPVVRSVKIRRLSSWFARSSSQSSRSSSHCNPVTRQLKAFSTFLKWLRDTPCECSSAKVDRIPKDARPEAILKIELCLRTDEFDGPRDRAISVRFSSE